MIIDTAKLSKDQQVYLEMQQLFEAEGYRKFTMRKFEEYSLYLENKSFLSSENVITFNAPDGKLMALKPDVTLSIVKNAKATGKSNEKLYYRESVYRLDKSSGEFKENNQMGLEFIGDLDIDTISQICVLALNSLRAIDSKFIFAVSHMGYIEGLLEYTGIAGSVARNEILGCIKNKNAHDLKIVAEKNGAERASVKALCAIASGKADFPTALSTAEEFAENDDMKSAVDELKNVYYAVKDSGLQKNIKLDFSILNDIDYYNGIIFQGFVNRMPKMILSGGRYDRLTEKFQKKVGAMGFAFSLSDLASFYQRENEVSLND